MEVESYGSFHLVRILQRSAASWAARRVASRYYQSWGSYGGRFAGGSHLRQSAALGAWYFACALLCQRVRESGGSLRESLDR